MESSCSIEPGRGRLELDTREPLYLVEAEIPQDHGRCGPAFDEDLASPGPFLPPHLEEVGKIGSKPDPEPHIMGSVIEVVNEEPLVTRVLPNIFEPVHMDQFGSQGDPIARDQFGVRQVDGQHRVVLLHIRAEQEERRTIQPQLEL